MATEQKDNFLPEELPDDEDMFVTLILDDGEEQECLILTIFEVGERDYIALLPKEDSGDVSDEDGDVYLYRYEEDDEGNPELFNIEDDDEYEMVVEAFDALLEDEEES